MISHRGAEFASLIERCTRGLQAIFKTSQPVITFAASGTGGMEAAVVNTLSPGDRVLSVSVGVFGDRFGRICRNFGLEVDELRFEWGEPADPDALADRLAGDGGRRYAAVTLTHNETSTAITNDTATLAKIVRDYGALALVDAVSGMLATEFRFDEWDVDAAVAGSQKAFMLPPGLCFVALGPRGWEAAEKSALPKFYWDLRAMKASLEKGQTAYTPAVGMMFGLDAALELILEEGVDQTVERHRRLAEGVRGAVEALGLKLFSARSHASNAVTAILPPPSVAADDIRKHISSRYGVVFSGGQAKLRGQIFRIAHMGAVAEKDMMAALGALEMTLAELGAPVELGSGVRAAQSLWLGGRLSPELVVAGVRQ